MLNQARNSSECEPGSRLSPRRTRRWRITGAMLGMALLAGCGSTVIAEPAAQISSTPTPESSPTVPSRPPIDEEQLEQLLQTSATDPAPPNACPPTDVALRLGTLDVALGHRFTQLVVRNTGSLGCVLVGTPGLGAVGEHGSSLWLDLELRDSIDDRPAQQVLLPPGAEAYANVEWTGALAGAETEHAQVLIVQLAADQPPLAFAPPGSGSGHPANQQVLEPYEWETDAIRDLGAGTTVRIGPWRN